MINLYRFGGLLAALLISTNIYAGNIQIENAWTRATAPGQEAAGVDMTITSQQAATLVSVSSPVAEVELHRMQDENGMMKMREVKSVVLPAGKRMNLHEAGYHLMLVGLKAPFKEGETVPLTLNFKVGKQSMLKLETKAEVRSLHATSDAAQGSEHRHNH